MCIRDSVIIVHSDGSQEALGLGGYLDIGLIDTMKDLMVNFLGAVDVYKRQVCTWLMSLFMRVMSVEGPTVSNSV